MSTRSTISVEHADGTISSVYCHNDGYLDGVGKWLTTKYNTQQAAEELVALGDLSSIYEEPLAYHRDRGEAWEDVQPAKFSNRAELVEAIEYEEYGQEYDYLYYDGRWHVLENSAWWPGGEWGRVPENSGDV